MDWLGRTEREKQLEQVVEFAKRVRRGDSDDECLATLIQDREYQPVRNRMVWPWHYWPIHLSPHSGNLQANGSPICPLCFQEWKISRMGKSSKGGIGVDSHHFREPFNITDFSDCQDSVLFREVGVTNQGHSVMVIKVVDGLHVLLEEEDNYILHGASYVSERVQRVRSASPDQVDVSHILLHDGALYDLSNNSPDILVAAQLPAYRRICDILPDPRLEWWDYEDAEEGTHNDRVVLGRILSQAGFRVRSS